MPPVLITAEKLTKQFTSRPLFSGLDFAISEGDHIGLVGPNGAGKSTLGKILAGSNGEQRATVDAFSDGENDDLYSIAKRMQEKIFQIPINR